MEAFTTPFSTGLFADWHWNGANNNNNNKHVVQHTCDSHFWPIKWIGNDKNHGEVSKYLRKKKINKWKDGYYIHTSFLYYVLIILSLFHDFLLPISFLWHTAQKVDMYDHELNCHFQVRVHNVIDRR